MDGEGHKLEGFIQDFHLGGVGFYWNGEQICRGVGGHAPPRCSD